MANGFSNTNNNNIGQIACRLCNRIFLTTQALITHIESHMEHEKAAIRRLYSSPQPMINSESQRQFVFPPPNFSSQNMNDGRIFQPNLVTPPQPTRRNPLRLGNSSQPIRSMMQFPSYGYSTAGNSNNNNHSNNNNNNVSGLLLSKLTQWKAEEESSEDGTREFIKQLDKPIKKIDFIDLDINDDDVHNLDLTLRL